MRIEKEDIPEMWETTLRFLYNDEYVSGLTDFLQENGAKKVLDCACGTGYPAIQLAKAGFDVTCTDADTRMLERFTSNARKEGVLLQPKKVDWRELRYHFDPVFDAVLCRGNALIYIESWDGYMLRHPGKITQEIDIALGNFYKVLKPGGILYIDIYDEKELALEGPVDFEPREIDGIKMSLNWTVKFDENTKRRSINSVRRILNRGAQRELLHTYRSLFLRHEELVKLMEKAGFKNVKKVEIPGEKNYTVYVGHK